MTVKVLFIYKQIWKKNFELEKTLKDAKKSVLNIMIHNDKLYASGADLSFRVYNTDNWELETTKTYPSIFLFRKRKNCLATMLSYNDYIITGKGDGRIDVLDPLKEYGIICSGQIHEKPVWNSIKWNDMIITVGQDLKMKSVIIENNEIKVADVDKLINPQTLCITKDNSLLYSYVDGKIAV